MPSWPLCFDCKRGARRASSAALREIEAATLDCRMTAPGGSRRRW
jgi:hypothetical protein